jgi:hypothetical protein
MLASSLNRYILIRLTLILILIIFGYCLTMIFDTGYHSVSDFEQVHITNYFSYIDRRLGRRATYRKIVIRADRKEYSFYPSTPLIQESSEFDKLYRILLRSKEVKLWIDKDDSIMGLQADGQLIIPPIQGIKYYERERKLSIALSVIFFVIGVLSYRYVKKGSNLDWKLSPRR